jgi:CHAT domain-containing protein
VLWVIGRDSIAAFDLPQRATIEALVREASEALSEPSRTIAESLTDRQARLVRARAAFDKIASALSRALLAPAAGSLREKRLLILADGALSALPFAALPLPGKSQSLAEVHEVFRAPSASVWASLGDGRPRSAPAQEVALIADPVFDDADTRVKKPLGVEKASVSKTASPQPTDVGLPSYARLRYSRQEALEIASLLPAKSRLVALDFQADRQLVTGSELAGYSVVHFATHALLNDRFPEISGVVLSLVDPAGKPQEGFLRLHEIFNLRLNARLVVLSGCRTALGRQLHGEGRIGLTRGFLYAGARAVIASLWSVDDRATAWFMGRFYRHLLADRASPSAALRSAQIDMRRRPEWRDPYYWAAFVCEGDCREKGNITAGPPGLAK